MLTHRRFIPFVALIALAACGRDGGEVSKPIDPAVSVALAGPLLTEPDLSAMNGAGRALTGNGVASALIPANLETPEGSDAARAEAKRLVGAAVQPAPSATSDLKAVAGQTALQSLRLAFGRSNCENGVGWSAVWATRLPEPAVIYPRGHVEEALGSDAPGCKLRAVTFRTALPASEVLDFYWTRFSRAGFRLDHRADGDAHAVHAGKGGSTMVVFVKPGHDELTEVHVLTRNP